MTHDEYVRRVDEVHKGDIEVLGEYHQGKEKIKLKHKKCGNEWYAAAGSIVYGGVGCPKCAHNATVSEDEFLRRVAKKHNGGITVIGPYVSMHKKVKFRHTCGHEWSAKPSNVICNGTGCPKCGGSYPLTHDFFVYRLKEIHGDTIEIVDGYYINNKSSFKLRHCIDGCGYVWKTSACKIIYAEHGCPRCGGVAKLEQGDFERKINDIHFGDIEVVGEYKGNTKPVKFRHAACGHEWESIASYVLQGSGCPMCSKSRGEKLIVNILSSRNVNFSEQFRFDDCRSKKPLPFDFAIFDGDKLLFLVEYDGIQHFEPVVWFGGEKSFKLLKHHDDIKNAYCTKRKIRLLRIPYWSTNDEVEEMIDTMIYESYHTNNVFCVDDDINNDVWRWR